MSITETEKLNRAIGRVGRRLDDIQCPEYGAGRLIGRLVREEMDYEDRRAAKEAARWRAREIRNS